MEFIHTADWLIGHRFNGVEPSLRQQLEEGIWQALELLFIYARKKRIPIILCAGNAFSDSQLADPKQLERLCDCAAQYPDIQLFIAPGTEDALKAGNIYSRVPQSRFPANLRVVMENQKIPFLELNATVYAAVAESRQEDNNPLQWLEKEHMDPNAINVGLCHYGHYKAGDTATLKLDYLACGGSTQYREIDPRCHYPGPPAQMDFGEPGFALHVKISNPGAMPRIKTITGIAPFDWLEERIQLSDNSYAETAAKLRNTSHRQIKKILVEGELSIRNYINYQDLLEHNRSGFYAIDDHVRVRPTDQDIEALDDESARGLIQALVALRAVEPSAGLEPGTVLKNKAGTFIMKQKSVADMADAIPDEEIIDRAMVSLYRQFGPSGQ